MKQEHKDKIRDAHIRNKHCVGRKLTTEHKKKIKENNGKYWLGKKRPELSGEKHPNWKGGFQKIPQKVLVRDNYTCQICGLKDDEIMQVDHIKPKAIYPELRHSLENLQTLCPNCHARKTIREQKEIIRIKKSKVNK